VGCLRTPAITKGVDGSSYDPAGSATRPAGAPGVTMRLSAGRFRRGLNVRRDQMASFLSRLVSEGAVAL
jgi:hypothetical protein